MSSPLWYLRALLWMIIASPVLLWAVRRAPARTLLALATGVFLIDLAARHPRWPLQTTRTPWIVGDFFLYAFFLCLGFLHRDGVLAKCNRTWWTLIAFASAIAGAAWVITQPVPERVVNDSHPAHLFIGFAWLAVFMAVAPLIERLASASFVGDVIRTINSRSLTIYLWHSTAIILGYHLLWNVETPLPRGLFTASVVGLMFAGTAAFVALFGWCEDLAGHRTPRLWPGALARNPPRREPQARRVIAGAMAISGAFGFFTVGTASLATLTVERGRRLRHRNGEQRRCRHCRRRDGDALAAYTVAGPRAAERRHRHHTRRRNREFCGRGDRRIDRHDRRCPHRHVGRHGPGVARSQRRRGSAVRYQQRGSLYWVDSVGSLGSEDSYDIFSVTKTLTTTLILREVEAGNIDLDAPLPPLSALPIVCGESIHGPPVVVTQQRTRPVSRYSDLSSEPEQRHHRRGGIGRSRAEPLLFPPGSEEQRTRAPTTSCSVCCSRISPANRSNSSCVNR